MPNLFMITNMKCFSLWYDIILKIVLTIMNLIIVFLAWRLLKRLLMIYGSISKNLTVNYEIIKLGEGNLLLKNSVNFSLKQNYSII